MRHKHLFFDGTAACRFDLLLLTIAKVCNRALELRSLNKPAHYQSHITCYKMSDIYEESVSEPEEVRMARLHSLLTKTKSPLLPKQKHIPRRPLILSPVRKSSNPRQPSHLVPESDDTAAEPRDTSPANTPSRPLRTISTYPIHHASLAPNSPPQNHPLTSPPSNGAPPPS